jgi:hypothetical protein
MPRRKWRTLNRREPLSEAVRVHLEAGRFSDDRKPEGWREVKFYLTAVEREGLWEIHRDAILSTWLVRHPGTRPWAWWLLDATEPRRCTAGAELLYPVRKPGDGEWIWRQNWGVPALLQCRPRGYVGLPDVEAQAAYLDRLGLLGADERTALAADAFDHETVNPFIADAEEIDRLLGAGHPQCTTTPRGERALSPGSRWPNAFQPRRGQ